MRKKTENGKFSRVWIGGVIIRRVVYRGLKLEITETGFIDGFIIPGTD